MTDAPKLIWAQPPDIFDGMGFWHDNPVVSDLPYIRTDAPELVALVEALREYKKRSRRIPFNVATDADRALAAWDALNKEGGV